MAAFYKPTLLEVGDTHVILYVAGDGVDLVLDRAQDGAATKYVQKLLHTNTERETRGTCAVLFLRTDGDDLITSVWSFDGQSGWPTQQHVSPRQFRNGIEETATIGNDELTVFGIEVRHGRTKKTMLEFVYGTRPEFPDGLLGDQPFSASPREAIRR